MTIEPPTWKFTSGNHAIIEMFKVTDEKEFTSLGPWDVSPENQPDGQSSFEKAKKMSQIAMEEGSNSFEWTHMRVTGETFPVTVFLTKVKLEDRTFLQATVRDISERKQVEKERENLQSQLSNALEMARLGHWEYDVANDLFTFNDQFYNIFRTTVKQVGGYTMSSAEYAGRFVHPDDIHIVGEEIRKVIEGADPNVRRQLEHRMIYADGTVGYISVQFFIVNDDQGKTIKTYGVNQDITERKLAEETLRKSENRFRDITNSMADWVWEIDKNGKYTFVSDTVKTVLGYSSEELIGKTPFDLMSAEERAKISEIFSEIAAKSRPIIDLENWNLAKDGTEVCFLTNGVPIMDADRKLQGYRGVDKDITNQKNSRQKSPQLKLNFGKPRKWNPSATLQAESLTTSTIFCQSSSALPS
ncbi:MAG: PAS domain-containing protein, partial [bacterium]